MRKVFWLLFALALPALAQDPVLPAVTVNICLNARTRQNYKD